MKSNQSWKSIEQVNNWEKTDLLTHGNKTQRLFFSFVVNLPQIKAREPGDLEGFPNICEEISS